MAKRIDNPSISKKDLEKYQNAYGKLMDELNFRTFDSTDERKEEIHSLMKEIDGIVTQEVEKISDLTGTDLTGFMIKLFNNGGGPPSQNTAKTISDLFESDGENAIASFFLDKQRDRNNTFKELDMLASQLHELKEAILVTRDSICTADDMSQLLSRVLNFEDADDDTKDELVETVEDIERTYKLQKKIKNYIVPNCLKYGEYYAYTIPYADLFERYHQYNNRYKNGVRESVSDIIDGKNLNITNDVNALIESVMDVTPELSLPGKGSKASDKEKLQNNINTQLKRYLSNYQVSNESYPIPVIEGEDLGAFLELQNAKQSQFIKDIEKRNTVKRNGSISTPDGTKEFKTNIGKKDVYIKLIDPTKLLPVEIMDETVGYYYISEVASMALQSFSNAIRITVNNQNAGSHVEDTFLHTICNKIVQSFDKKFLEENHKFKSLILNALMYNDAYKKQLRFQFIPAEYITKFVCNEDEDGRGHSMLEDSIYKAKLYLGLLIFKMMQIFTKSSDTRVYYVRNSGVDTDVVSQAQRVARGIKEGQANYYDILNPNASISKIGKAKDIFMPTGRSNERAIEFDILQGQDVQLNTEFMEMLKTDYINATGVPSVIMSYINEADYAKTLVMANSKFIGRNISYQLDFDESLTEFYQRILRFGTDMTEAQIQSFRYTFIKPKSLNNQNLNDLTSSTSQTTEYMLDSRYGTDNSDKAVKKREKVKYALSRYLLPMLPWDELEKMDKESETEMVKDDAEAKANSANTATPEDAPY